MLYPRNLKSRLLEAASDTPVILLNGARQTGKSTLLDSLAEHDGQTVDLVNLDDLTTLNAATSSPKSLLESLQARHVVIDEVQRAPELFLPIKELVDTNREPGRFLLTGSANVLTLPKLADTLAGRMEILTLWPLSQGELRSHREGFIDLLFSEESLRSCPTVEYTELLRLIVTGGYPEVVQRTQARRRAAWFQSYLTTILQRDIRELSNIEGLTALPNLLTLIATRVGGLLNASDLSRSLGMVSMTLSRYLSLLEGVFLVVSLPPWFSNRGKRLVKSPKLYLNDTGLLAHLLDLDADSLARNRSQIGALLENFVVMELLKQSGWSDKQVSLSHYRTHTGQEVDVVLEAGRRLVGIEIKAASTITSDHFKGLRSLQEQAGEAFHRGVVLYTGTETVAFGEQLWACPVSALWEMGTQPAEPLK